MASLRNVLREPEWSSDDDESTQKDPPAPESNQSNQDVKAPHCNCTSCHHWINSATWCPTPELIFEARAKGDYNKRPNPLLKTSEVYGNEGSRFVEQGVPKIVSAKNMKYQSKIQKQTVSNILVHSDMIMDHTELLEAANFNKDVHKVLQNMNYKYSTAIQSFAWPAILQGRHVFLTGSKNSGKTMSYIPAICSFASKKRQVSNHKGPLAIIICSNSSTCEQVFDLLQKILVQMHSEIKAAIITYPTAMRNKFDILITMPGSLIACIKSRMFTLKRLRFIAIEEADIVLSRNKEQIYNIFDGINLMLSHRINTKNVQLVVISEKWTSDLKLLLKKMFDIPLVCISNHLEAAIYGESKVIVKFLTTELKNKYLLDILKNKFHIMKTIILCESSEITAVNKYLVREGIEVLALSNTATKDDIDQKEQIWSTSIGGEYKVLICTDFILESLLSINDANWIIHYSLPATWKLFTNRFGASLVHYHSPLYKQLANSDCRCFVVIDENCNEKMLKIIDLLKRFTLDLHEFQTYFEDMKRKNEMMKIVNLIQLCDDLKLFGKCSNDICPNRHLVSEDLDITSDLPRGRKIHFKILNIKNVTNYTIQILKSFGVDGTMSIINSDDLSKPLTLSQYLKVNIAKKINIGASYFHCDYTPNGKEYLLCHVKSISKQKDCDDNLKDLVEVQLIGGQILQTLRTNLYEIPSSFGVVEAFITNLVPPQPDANFSGRALLMTRKSLSQKMYRNMIFDGNILLQMDKSVWLDNAIVKFEVDQEVHAVTFDLKKILLNLNVAVYDCSIIDSLYSLCGSFNIVPPKQEKSNIKKEPTAQEVEIEPAFLDEGVNEVILSSGVTPDEFYVRLTKFQRQLDDLEADMTKSAQIEMDLDTTVSVGKYYSTLDPSGATHARVQVLEIQGDTAICFYIDYGDDAVKKIKDLRILQNKYRKRLPFQAICCQLHGIFPTSGEWDKDSINVLYDYMFEEGTDIFRSLFAKVCTSEQINYNGVKTKYSVLLKDGFGQNKPLINQVFVDNGLASSRFEQLDDFDIPCDDNQENVESLEPSHGELSAENNFEEFDIEIFDEDVFLEQLGLPTKKMLSATAITGAATESKTKNTTKAVIQDVDQSVGQLSSSLTPDVYWTQDEYFVKIKIVLIGVENYKCNIVRKRLFEFSTILGDQKYELKFSLNKLASLIKHKAYGQDVRIILEKAEPLEWMQLSGTAKKLRNIHYQLPKEKEKVQKRFLQLDITDDESDEGGNDEPYYDISDRDSDYGGEFDDDSSDS